MSAASPSLEPNQTGPKKLGWVGPISASLLAGVGQAFVSFDLNWWGLMLLLACGALGSGLLRVPQNARTWDPPPTSSQATLKQTIGIARVLVYVSLVALPGIVFLTSEPIRKMFPPQIEDYISKYAPDSIKIESMFVFLPRERENVQDRPFYFAKLGSKPSGSNLTDESRGGFPRARWCASLGHAHRDQLYRQFQRPSPHGGDRFGSRQPAEACLAVSNRASHSGRGRHQRDHADSRGVQNGSLALARAVHAGGCGWSPA